VEFAVEEDSSEGRRPNENEYGAAQAGRSPLARARGPQPALSATLAPPADTRPRPPVPRLRPGVQPLRPSAGGANGRSAARGVDALWPSSRPFLSEPTSYASSSEVAQARPIKLGLHSARHSAPRPFVSDYFVKLRGRFGADPCGRGTAARQERVGPVWGSRPDPLCRICATPRLLGVGWRLGRRSPGRVGAVRRRGQAPRLCGQPTPYRGESRLPRLTHQAPTSLGHGSHRGCGCGDTHVTLTQRRRGVRLFRRPSRWV
jgi:hypothetical protein